MSQPSQRRAHFTTPLFEKRWLSIRPTAEHCKVGQTYFAMFAFQEMTPLNSAIARYRVEYSASLSSTMSATSGLRALRTTLL